MYRLYSTVTKPNLIKNFSYKVGEKTNGYLIKKIEEINDFNLIAIELLHEKTKAKHLHLCKPDDNINAFCVSFRTTPKNNTGAPHILEHLSLCGSEKYPCRDPFMNMLSRSVATFMNACTSCDHTYYPFSTYNLKDYENLLNIYLDATLHPLFRPIDFLQEGWRFEPKDLNNLDSELKLSGVVLNEMKDHYSNQAAIFYLSVIGNLLSDTIYKFDYGGHPFHIPELDNDQIINFHKTHYHPSNSKFYTYGNQSLEFYLSKINNYLKDFDANEKYKELSEIESQKKWSQEKSITIQCPPNMFNKDLNKQIMTSKAFLLTEITDSYENFVLNILSNLLVSGQNSPFYEALINSNLGSDFSPDTGYSQYTKQSMFSVGLQDIDENDINKVHDIIDKTLLEVKEKGFPKERIDSLLHSIELKSKHQTSSFGLNIINGLNNIWNHDGDVFEELKLNNKIHRLRNDLKKNPKFLQEKLEKYLIQNTHKLKSSMKPSETYLNEFKEKLENIGKKKASKLTMEDKKKIFKNSLELNEAINKKVNVEVLPCLNVEKDITKSLPQKTEIKNIKLLNDSIDVQIAERNTNELIYFKALSKINLDELSEDLLPYLAIFSDILTNLAAGEFDKKQMAQEIEANTSGLYTSLHLKNNLDTGKDCELYLFMNSYCFKEKTDKMLSLWEKFFNNLKLKGDEEHISQLIKMFAINHSQNITFSGHNFAVIRSSHSINAVGNLKEKLFGIDYIEKLNKIADKEDIGSIIEKLEKISKIVFNRNNLKLALNTDQSNIDFSIKSYEKFLNNLNNSQSNLTSTNKILTQFEEKNNLHEHYILPLNSNYVSKSINGVPFNHEDYAGFQLLTKLLSRKFLHTEIREKGSAYGSGLRMSLNGLMSFFSYRDPNIQKTLNVFEESFKWISNPNNFNEQDINEAKLNLFQDVDKPINPSNHGMNLFLDGINDEMLSDYRNKIFNISKSSLIDLTIKNFVAKNKKQGIACLGAKNEETNSSLWKHLN